ncbi:hypothetical protein [Methylomonas rosea]|uniref:Uncharacterized protein n=1 Tax=Methylomonas rosea TaxID=2952227 RepID=A0ABT1TRT2_9GAMM|nr:hypothetical protein [Methylomonas sp. WSC-7]MCQ8117485.1 hypothetical protein [Methylomonas sp. WSC-7]
MDILAIVESRPRRIAREALYYCLRALKQAGLPSESKKDYFHDSESSMPTEEGVALANEILSFIAFEEGVDLDHIEDHRIHVYLTEIAKASDFAASSVEGFNVETGQELLKRMRGEI